MARYVALTINRPPLSAASVRTVVSDLHTVAVDTDLAADDIVVLGKLGAGQEVVDAIYGSTDVDTNGTPTITGTVGILDSAGTDLESGGNIITSAEAGQAGTLDRMNVATAPLLASDDDDREVGFKVVTAGATKAAGTMHLQLFSRAS